MLNLKMVIIRTTDKNLNIIETETARQIANVFMLSENLTEKVCGKWRSQEE